MLTAAGLNVGAGEGAPLLPGGGEGENATTGGVEVPCPHPAIANAATTAIPAAARPIPYE